MTQTQWGREKKGVDVYDVNKIIHAMDVHFGEEYKIPASYVDNVKNIYHDLNIVLDGLTNDIQNFSEKNELSFEECRKIWGVLAFQWFIRKIELQEKIIKQKEVKKVKWGQN